MATLTLYPVSVKTAYSFTTAQLANVLGNTTATAVHTGSITVNTVIGGVFYFNMTDLPANAVISSLQVSIIASANALSRRKIYSIDVYKTSTGNAIISTIDTALTTTLTQYNGTISAAQLAAQNLTTANLRDNGLEWTTSISSTNTTSTTTTWQKFFLTFTYELAVGGTNVLFQGENF